MKSVASQAVEKPPRSSGWRQSGEPPGPAASRLPTTGFETTDAMVSDLDSIGGFGLKFQIDLRRQFSHASGPGCGQRGACLINVLAVHDPLRVALPGPANRSRFRSAVARAETRVRALPPRPPALHGSNPFKTRLRCPSGAARQGPSCRAGARESHPEAAVGILKKE
jgi:hypothetical protein